MIIDRPGFKSLFFHSLALTVDKVLSSPELHCVAVKDGTRNTYRVRLLWDLNSLLYLKCSAQCLAHGTCSVSDESITIFTILMSEQRVSAALGEL